MYDNEWVLDDDLFWMEDRECGEDSITTPPDYTSEIVLSVR
jgi:hypothetical protein